MHLNLAVMSVPYYFTVLLCLFYVNIEDILQWFTPLSANQ